MFDIPLIPFILSHQTVVAGAPSRPNSVFGD